MSPALGHIVFDIRDTINQQTSELFRCARVYRERGDDASAEYCQQLRMQLWQLADEIAADAMAAGILPNGGA